MMGIASLDQVAWLPLSFGISMLVTRFAIHGAERLGFVARPDPTVPNHLKPVPLLGGVGILAGFVPALIVLPPGSQRLGFGCGLLLIALLGAYKDRIGKSVSSPAQLLVQGAAILVLFVGGLGLRQTGVTVVDVALTLAVGLCVINSVNFLDVMDGLAGGMALIIIVGLSLLMLLAADVGWLAPAFAATGAIAGFLVYNVHPARLFMGDIGSFGIGFILLGFLFHLDEIGQFHIALVLYGGLFVELFASTLMRIHRGRHVLIGDGTHISLIMLARGHGVQGIVALFWLVTLLCVIAGLLLFVQTRPASPPGFNAMADPGRSLLRSAIV